MRGHFNCQLSIFNFRPSPPRNSSPPAAALRQAARPRRASRACRKPIGRSMIGRNTIGCKLMGGKVNLSRNYDHNIVFGCSGPDGSVRIRLQGRVRACRHLPPNLSPSGEAGSRGGQGPVTSDRAPERETRGKRAYHSSESNLSTPMPL